MTNEELTAALKEANEAVNKTSITDWLARGTAVNHLKALQAIQLNRATVVKTPE